MIISPRVALEKGWIKAAPEAPPINPELQVQQAGIDLRVGDIHIIRGSAVICEDKDTKRMPSYLSMPLNPDGFYNIHGGHGYAIDALEEVEVPNDVAALIIHRSSFNRSATLIFGSVYDPGFRGVVGCSMYPHIDLAIEWGVRFAQIMFMECEAASLYKGQYQDQAGKVGLNEKLKRSKK